MTTRLPTGRFALTPAIDDRVRALSGAPPRQGDAAHPILAYVGALNGLARPIGEVARALGLAFDSGPVLGRCEIDLPGALRVDQVYEVEAEVSALTRKASRRFGQADHAGFVITLAQGGQPVSVLRFAMITPVIA